MAISFTRYVDITSGVIAGTGVKQRQLILRLFTTNPLVPTDGFLEFDNANDAETYFGSGSAEYLQLASYFSFISKNITAPPSASVAFWAQSNTHPLIYGDPKATDTLSAFQAITAGHLNLTLGATTEELTGLNFASDMSLAAVATTLQTAINAVTADPQWHTAVVAYNSTTGAFDLTGGAAVTTGGAPVSVAAAATGTDVGAAIGWLSALAIFSPGIAAQTLTATMVANVTTDNNFGSFAFVPALNTTQITELATWNATQNVDYMFLPAVTSSNAAAVSAAIIGIEGSGITLAPLSTEYPHLLPASILAATNYNNRNASQNYMYQNGQSFTPSVTDDTDANTYDPLRVNYWGVTQTAGQLIAFYQRGVMTGGGTAPTDMNIYANEMWFKDYVGTQLLALLLALTEISTNPTGRSQILAVLQGCVGQALFNGVISVGKQLTVVQQLDIVSITGDPNSWRTVQSIGYWIDVSFSSYVTTDGRTEYQANYILVYAKNDAIRKVVGSHDLV